MCHDRKARQNAGLSCITDNLSVRFGTAATVAAGYILSMCLFSREKPRPLTSCTLLTVMNAVGSMANTASLAL